VSVIVTLSTFAAVELTYIVYEDDPTRALTAEAPLEAVAKSTAVLVVAAAVVSVSLLAPSSTAVHVTAPDPVRLDESKPPPVMVIVAVSAAVLETVKYPTPAVKLLEVRVLLVKAVPAWLANETVDEVEDRTNVSPAAIPVPTPPDVAVTFHSARPSSAGEVVTAAKVIASATPPVAAVNVEVIKLAVKSAVVAPANSDCVSYDKASTCPTPTIIV
jgi:hypothetical protein